MKWLTRFTKNANGESPLDVQASATTQDSSITSNEEVENAILMLIDVTRSVEEVNLACAQIVASHVADTVLMITKNVIGESPTLEAVGTSIKSNSVPVVSLVKALNEGSSSDLLTGRDKIKLLVSDYLRTGQGCCRIVRNAAGTMSGLDVSKSSEWKLGNSNGTVTAGGSNTPPTHIVRKDLFRGRLQAVPFSEALLLIQSENLTNNFNPKSRTASNVNAMMSLAHQALQKGLGRVIGGSFDLYTDKQVSDKVYKGIMDQVAKRYGGDSSSTLGREEVLKPLMLQEGMTAKPTPGSVDGDLVKQINALKISAQRLVCGVYGVPPVLVGIEETGPKESKAINDLLDISSVNSIRSMLVTELNRKLSRSSTVFKIVQSPWQKTLKTGVREFNEQVRLVLGSTQNPSVMTVDEVRSIYFGLGSLPTTGTTYVPGSLHTLKDGELQTPAVGYESQNSGEESDQQSEDINPSEQITFRS